MSSGPHSDSCSLAAATLAALIGVCAAGCATSYHVNVDALQNPRAVQSGYSYRIEASDSSRSNDAHFAEVAALVRTALSGRGMYEAPEGEEPSVIVGLDYGVGPVQTRLIQTIIPDPGSPRQIDPISGRSVSGDPNARLGSVGTRSGISGSSTGPGYREDFFSEKYLTIVGRASSPTAAAAEPRIELWRVHVTVEDDGDDIANYIAVLAAAAADYIGTDTQEKQRLRVSERDEVVDFIKQGL